MNFNVVANKLDKDEVISNIESTVRQLPETRRNMFRHDMKLLLNKWTPAKPNLKALNELKCNTGITVLPADKGRVTVVMTKTKYTQKMEELLSGSEYQVSKTDPTNSIIKRVSQIANLLKKKGSIDNRTRLHLVSGGHSMPRIYGLPKIHKYKLAQFVSNMISPLVGRSPHHVKNSTEFASFIRNHKISEKSTMVSFDVVSLFPKVPVPAAIDQLKIILTSVTEFLARNKIDADDVIQMVKLCMSSTIFAFQDK